MRFLLAILIACTPTAAWAQCGATVQLGDNWTFAITTHNASTGAITNADGAPAYDVYEDESATQLLTGTMAQLDSQTGFYSEQVAVTAANGFEASKSYNTLITAAVSSITGGKVCGLKVAAGSQYANGVAANVPVIPFQFGVNTANASSLDCDLLIDGSEDAVDGSPTESTLSNGLTVWSVPLTATEMTGDDIWLTCTGQNMDDAFVVVRTSQ